MSKENSVDIRKKYTFFEREGVKYEYVKGNIRRELVDI